MISRIFLVSLALFSGSSFAWAEAPQGNSCVTCHLDLWEEMKTSVHSQQGIYCNSCHGGDPAQTTKELAKAPGTGYVGIPDKKQLVETCGACHANVEVMNFYGVRTDQLARYKTSHHGKKLFGEGDTRVAGCSDCHGYHDVVAVSDPASPVYPLNVPKTCDHCHGNEKLMSRYHLPSDAFKLYQTSVHGKALFEKKDLSVAHCASCHGSHGAVPPGVKEIGATCGKCHVNEKKYFLESVHAQPMQQGKFSECVSCHGNHGVQHADKRLYREACVKCHEAGSTAAKKGGEIFEVLKKSDEELRSAEKLVRRASIEGIFVEEEMGALEEAKTNVISMAPLQHSLSIEKISELYQKFEGVARDIQTRVLRKRQALRWRKISLVPLWIFVGIMIVALGVQYRRLKKDHEGKGPRG
ncbi:MAG: cytochrome c3 family protein [Candidatus Omnitrophica bacterium]|nr:cytochrome c3 family protein [Candidatus Omnitrophota bacterium]